MHFSAEQIECCIRGLAQGNDAAATAAMHNLKTDAIRISCLSETLTACALEQSVLCYMPNTGENMILTCPILACAPSACTCDQADALGMLQGERSQERTFLQKNALPMS